MIVKIIARKNCNPTSKSQIATAKCNNQESHRRVAYETLITFLSPNKISVLNSWVFPHNKNPIENNFKLEKNAARRLEHQWFPMPEPYPWLAYSHGSSYREQTLQVVENLLLHIFHMIYPSIQYLYDKSIFLLDNFILKPEI
jgi:hypothetical protein